MSSYLVRVELGGSWENRPEGPVSGSALGGWLCAEALRGQPELAGCLEGPASLRPFSAALLGGSDPRVVLTGYGPLANLVEQMGREPPERLLLSGAWWRRAGPPVVHSVAWSELALPLLDRAAWPSARLRFLSPTTFREGRAWAPLPAAQQVFGSLLERWERWAPLDLGAGAREVVAQGFALRRFAARSVLVRVPAFLGWAEWRVQPLVPPAYRGLLRVLAGFAELAGVGHNVQGGFGCVCLEPAGGGRSPRPSDGGAEDVWRGVGS